MASDTDSKYSADLDKIAPDGKIYCANCYHCKLSMERFDTENGYKLRVRCAAGQWTKKQGEEKLYRYSTVIRRSPDYCDHYEPMGSLKEFLRELKKSLPVQDEIYANE